QVLVDRMLEISSSFRDGAQIGVRQRERRIQTNGSGQRRLRVLVTPRSNESDAQVQPGLCEIGSCSNGLAKLRRGRIEIPRSKQHGSKPVARFRIVRRDLDGSPKFFAGRS